MQKLLKTTTLLTSFVLGASLFISNGVSANGLKDLEGHWAKSQIQSWNEKGLAKGYQDGTFKPNRTITRAEFMTLLNQSFGLTEQAPILFTDVNSRDWFSSEVAKAVKEGYVSGFSDGTVRPNQPVSRQEVAIMLSNVMKLTNEKTSSLDGFKDSVFPQWSKGSIASVVETGLMNGYPDQTFKPDRLITRAEAIVTLDQALKARGLEETKNSSTVYSSAGTYGPQQGSETIEGDVVITSDLVVLQNIVIKGNLLIAESVGEGNTLLKNVTVQGQTTVKGGGPNSVIFQDSTLGAITVNKKAGDIRLQASGKTSIREVKLESRAKLEEKDLTTGSGFSQVVVSGAPEQSIVTLLGAFDSVTIQSSNVTLEVQSGLLSKLVIADQVVGSKISLAEGVKVAELVLDAAAQVNGKGSIEKAIINTSGSTFEQAPSQISNKENATWSVGTPAAGVGGGGAPGSVAIKPVVTDMYLDGLQFINGKVTLPNSSHKIHMLTFGLNVDSSIEILSVTNQDGDSVLGVFNRTGSAKVGEPIDLIRLLGLGDLDPERDGIRATHFVPLLNPGGSQASITMEIKLTNGNQETTLIRTVDIP